MDETRLPTLGWTCDRRYGVEMEINAFDGLDRPLNTDDLPKGIETVAEEVRVAVHAPVNVMPWHPTHNNDNWIVKPDSSCGMEVCSPILKGWRGLEGVVRVAQAFKQHPLIESDKRCSFHVHANVHDCSPLEVASIVAYWIKCEAVFIDSVPPNRKRSRYCQIVGMSDLFDVRDALKPQNVTSRMGQSKYFTLNNYHYSRDARHTIEFRIAENDACTDPVFVKNWTRLVVHFCEATRFRALPARYDAGDPWSSLCWLDPIDVFKLLGFMPGQYDLSPGLTQTRNWFLARLLAHTRGHGVTGVFSDVGRSYAWKEVQEIARLCGFPKAHDGDYAASDLDRHLAPPPRDLEAALYDKNLRA